MYTSMTPEHKIIKNWLHNTMQLGREELIKIIERVVERKVDARLNEFFSGRGGIDESVRITTENMLLSEFEDLFVSERFRDSMTVKKYAKKCIKDQIADTISKQIRFRIVVENINE